MSFFPKLSEIIEQDDLYEFSGDEDDRLRKEYEKFTEAMKNEKLCLDTIVFLKKYSR